ncbi:MAG TPA: type II toxin-antitoxin system HicB family antitoxin [Xanthobacteraceae bacterium]|nr:type II toxin-antitoxin system HicB family antitoxin [Xanthobacteraceae bacterium]
MNRYAIVVFWSDEDEAWVADGPDLKSCSAFGDTPEAAVAEVRIAMEAWLAAARETGKPIPPPQFQPHHEAAE